ncbi:MAG: PAS domain S-box protein, partial [Candidatus Auribacterota bacterium]|nr:PAS domain S-box protein [Candidatus Auribacterota bacterium]
KERARELSVLNRVIVAACTAEDITTLLKNILDSTLELLDFDGGGIYLVDETEGEAELCCSKGLNQEFLEEVQRVKTDEEPYATVFIRKQSIITDNYQKVSPGHSERSGLLSTASIPIFSKDRVVGALNVGSKKRHSFSRQEVDILQALVRETESALSRMRAEEGRRESEERFRAVFETARDCIFIKDTRLKYVQVNPAMEKLFGLPALKIIGRTDEKFFGQKAGEHIKEVDLRVLKGEIVEEEDTKPVKGAEITFHVVKVPMRDSSGEIIGLCGISRDITERKEWEERIAYLSLAAERMGEIVIVTDLNHVITYANSAVEDILGYRPEEIVGQDSREFFKGVPGNPPDLVQRIKDDDTMGIWRGELFNRRKDGAIIKIHLTLSPLKDRSGTLLGYVGVSLDITERERLEAELRHAQKMEAIGTLAGGLAHDFNNILSGIIGYAFLTRKGLPEGSSYIPDMETIENLAQRGSDLTGSLLTLARRGEYRPEPLNIAGLIEEVINVIKVSLGKDIDFQITISPDLSNILGDRGQCHQVIMNLCINACEAMPDGGVLTVRASNFSPDLKFFNHHPRLKVGDYIYLEISDTGVGMDAGTRTRIFDPFYTTKAEKSGTGLGLSVVNGIIEKHDGHIEVESEPGRGSTFRIYLPATKKQIKIEPAVSVEAAGGEETILVVDDEKEVRGSTVRWLQKLGYTVFEAEDGEVALEVLEEKKDDINLVLLDMIMGEMGGAETFKRMKKISPTLPIIICSGYSLGDDIRRLLKDGASSFIRKPYTPDKLTRKIREVLGGEN